MALGGVAQYAPRIARAALPVEALDEFRSQTPEHRPGEGSTMSSNSALSPTARNTSSAQSA
jgi:hypothetical protein